MTYNVSNTSFKIGSLPAISVLSTTTGIDAKVAATTNLYTVPSGRKAVVTGAVLALTTVDTLTLVGTAGIGVAAGEADIFPAIALTGLSTTTTAMALSNNNLLFAVAQASDVVKLGIDVGYTATTATMRVDLLGYLI